LLSLSGRQGEAARILELAIVVHHRLMEWNPRSGPFRHGLALALLHSGRVQVQLGLPRRAEPALRQALGLMRQLVQDDPLVKEYWATRLLAAGYLGEAFFRQGRTVAAAELLQEVEKDGEEVLGGSPRPDQAAEAPVKNRGLRGQHARLLHVLGYLERESGDLDRGLGACRKAHEKLEQAVRETPGDRSLRSDWLSNREALARCRFLEGELTLVGWIAEQQCILQERKDLVEQGPLSPRYAGEYAGSAAVLAGLLLEAGRPTEALACVDEVLPGHEKVVRTEQDRVQTAAKKQQEVEPNPVLNPGYTGSLQLFLRKMPIVSDNSLHRDWARLLGCRAAALSRVGRGQEAVAAVRQAVGLTAGLVWGDRPFHPPPASLASLGTFLPTLLWPAESCHLYDLACHLALASTLQGPEPAEQAVRALRWCVAAGFDNPHKLRTDPALEPLRKREDFRKLVHDLEDISPRRKDVPLNPK
jgi:tetratricopeptide (TPR) repeat protein